MKQEHWVMIVEDDADVRDALVEVLEDNLYATLCAANGEEALEKARAARVKPCVILLDIMMPIMDGWTFRANQLEDAELRSIPTGVITAHGNARDEADKMAADAWLKKPIRLDTLVSTVRRFCGIPAPDAA
jgi:CheY-like chemotaxis protein